MLIILICYSATPCAVYVLFSCIFNVVQATGYYRFLEKKIHIFLQKIWSSFH